MPAYRVEFDPSADRDLERLSPLLLERLAARVEALSRDPRPPGSQKLTGVDAYRIRVGDHRIIYEVDDEVRTVVITRIRHRREVYRKLR